MIRFPSAVPYRVIFENERVRVLDVTAEPGEKAQMHGHPDSVMHALNDAAILVTTEQGESHSAEVAAGTTFWNAATTQSARR